MNLSSNIIEVPGVGPKSKKLLEKLGIKTVEDLIYHLPFRYQDYSKFFKIKDLMAYTSATVRARIERVDNIFTRSGKRLTKARVFDETGKMDLIWFNSHFIKKQLTIGEEFNFSGNVQAIGNKIGLMSPEFEKAERNNINTGRLVPVYPETTGISSKWLRARNNDVIRILGDIKDFLPLNILIKNKLIGLNDALNKIHFPITEYDVKTAKHRLSFDEFFLELLKVEERKSNWNSNNSGVKMRIDKLNTNVESFIQTLPYNLTTWQKEACIETLNDMSKTVPMNRLLEGDVGSGKTVVAVISSYFAYLNGYKTLYLAPTEILATQHFETFKMLFDKTRIRISLVTSAKRNLDDGWDVLVGTHAILFSEEYKNIGLVVVDEQHRFGVEQREKIKLMGTSSRGKIPHFLSMTATPIPRTLALTLYGDLSISALKTGPHLNKEIKTWVVPEEKRSSSYEWILKNLSSIKKGQVFIVCPFIEESEIENLENIKSAKKEFEQLKSGVFKNVKMGLLHGKMKSLEKDKIIQKFRTGEIRVLVSTPVIEVGVDIPEAEIIIIESAERYGLASLHQLRGRVGRKGGEAFCLLFMSNYSNTAFKRLKYLESIDSGIELAEIDIKMRGRGDIFGTIQHGYKKFKIADISDLKLLELAKMTAQQYYPKISEYHELERKFGTMNTKLIGNN